MFADFWRVFTHDIAIDLGTANTLVAIGGVGVVFEEPSVVAINKKNNQVLAIGSEAKKMAGRTPASVVVIRPLRDGVISDFVTTEAMIRYFIQKVYEEYANIWKINKPRVIVGVPSLITEVEARAVIDAAKSAGARKVYVIEEPIAAAIGSGMVIDEAIGNMIIDIGGGTSDIAIISLGGMVVDNTIKIAGDEMDEAIVSYVKHKYNLLISPKLAEEAKLQIGSATPLKEELSMSMSGRDIVNGLPKTITLTSIEVREALDPVLNKIAVAAKEALEKTPPEIVVDLVQRGVIIAGGGALLRGIDKYFSDHLKTKVTINKDPLQAVVNGTYKLLDNIDLLERVQITDESFV